MELFKKESSDSGIISLKVINQNQILMEVFGKDLFYYFFSSDDSLCMEAFYDYEGRDYVVFNHRGCREIIALMVRVFVKDKNDSEKNIIRDYYCILEIPENIEDIDHLKIFNSEGKDIFFSNSYLFLGLSEKKYLYPLIDSGYKSIRKLLNDGAIIVKDPSDLLKLSMGRISEEDLQVIISEYSLKERFEDLQKKCDSLEKVVKKLKGISNESMGSRFSRMKKLLNSK